MEKTFVMLYGAVAVGKLTTAKILAEKTGLKLVHNHLLIDLVGSVFKRDDEHRDEMLENLRFNFYSEVANYGESIIVTHTYVHNYVAKTSLTDPEYMQRLEKIFLDKGYKTLFVHLKASEEKLLERVSNEDRKEFKKLTDKQIMSNNFAIHDYETPAPVKNNIVIENNTTDANAVVEKILECLEK